MIKSDPRITFISKEVTVLPEDGPVIIATGPLTSEALSQDIVRFFGSESPLSFFDAAAPIVEFDSIDMTKAFFASRYGKGSPDYINCPLDEAEYDAFWRELNGAKTAEVHGFENAKVFEGCMPVEVMAARGRDTLRYGPMKPIGITDPVTGRKAYAVLQLRRDNAEGTLYNIVGFQTHLTFGEQKRVFSMIPALRHASFVRYGVMHRNTYINSPKLLTRYYEARKNPDILFAGQMTGVEGYIESTCSGLYAAVNLARRLKAQPRFALGSDTAIGALSMYISGGASADFQPMNVNFGILTPLAERIKKNEKKLALSTRALAALDEAIAQSGEDFTAVLPKKDPHDED